jgi:hypothetical protein
MALRPFRTPGIFPSEDHVPKVSRDVYCVDSNFRDTGRFPDAGEFAAVIDDGADTQVASTLTMVTAEMPIAQRDIETEWQRLWFDEGVLLESDADRCFAVVEVSGEPPMQDTAHIVLPMHRNPIVSAVDEAGPDPPAGVLVTTQFPHGLDGCAAGADYDVEGLYLLGVPTDTPLTCADVVVVDETSFVLAGATLTGAVSPDAELVWGRMSGPDRLAALVTVLLAQARAEGAILGTYEMVYDALNNDLVICGMSYPPGRCPTQPPGSCAGPDEIKTYTTNCPERASSLLQAVGICGGGTQAMQPYAFMSGVSGGARAVEVPAQRPCIVFKYCPPCQALARPGCYITYAAVRELLRSMLNAFNVSEEIAGPHMRAAVGAGGAWIHVTLPFGPHTRAGFALALEDALQTQADPGFTVTLDADGAFTVAHPDGLRLDLGVYDTDVLPLADWIGLDTGAATVYGPVGPAGLTGSPARDTRWPSSCRLVYDVESCTGKTVAVSAQAPPAVVSDGAVTVNDDTTIVASVADVSGLAWLSVGDLVTVQNDLDSVLNPTVATVTDITGLDVTLVGDFSGYGGGEVVTVLWDVPLAQTRPPPFALYLYAPTDPFARGGNMVLPDQFGFLPGRLAPDAYGVACGHGPICIRGPPYVLVTVESERAQPDCPRFHHPAVPDSGCGERVIGKVLLQAIASYDRSVPGSVDFKRLPLASELIFRLRNPWGSLYRMGACNWSLTFSVEHRHR